MIMTHEKTLFALKICRKNVICSVKMEKILNAKVSKKVKRPRQPPKQGPTSI